MRQRRSIEFEVHSRILPLVAVVIFGSALAAVPPPQSPFGDTISWPPVSTSPPAVDLAMGRLKIRFEKTTLQEILQAAGRGELAHEGDAAGSVYWLCYSLPGQRIWIMSNGEMGGRDHVVTQVDARVTDGVAHASECPPIPKALRPISLHGGIWLNSTLAAVTRALGPASHTDAQWRSFDYAGKVAGSCKPDGFDLTNWVLVRTVHGHVVDIRAGQVTSC